MAAPEYVPTTLSELPRTGLKLPPADRWVARRPGELGPRQPTGRHLGDPGPDKGYAWVLARRFQDRLVLEADEHAEDAVGGCTPVATRRSALFGRAPVIHDLEVAFRIWGFLGDSPPELVALRRPLFQAVSHHYWDQRGIVDRVPEATLRLSHEEVRRRFPGEWRALLGL